MQQFRGTKNTKITFIDFIAEYIEKNFEDCLDVIDQLVHLEEASRYQPEFSKAEISRVGSGLNSVEKQYNETAEDKKGIYYQYWNRLAQFLETALPLQRQLEQSWDDFELFGQEILHTFGLSQDPLSPLPDVLLKIHQFASKFREQTQRRKLEQEERRKLHEWSENWFGSDGFHDYDEATLKAKERRREQREAQAVSLNLPNLYLVMTVNDQEKFLFVVFVESEYNGEIDTDYYSRRVSI